MNVVSIREKNNSRTNEDLPSDMRRLFGIVGKNWKLLLAITMLGGVFGFFLGMVLPKQYESDAVVFVKVKQPTKSSAAAMLMDDQVAQCSYIIGLLKSRPLRDLVCKQLSTVEISKLGLDKPNPDMPLSFQRDDPSRMITITCRLRDPNLAAKFINLSLDAVGRLFTKHSRKDVTFISSQMQKTERQLENLGIETKAFQDKYKTWSVDDDAKGIIAQIRDLEAQKNTLDASLSALQSQLSGEVDPDELVKLRVQRNAQLSSLKVLGSQLSKLQNQLAGYPEIARKFVALQRKRDTLEKAYAVLCEQYQLAALPQIGEDGDYEIIERAVPIHEAVFPRKKTTSAVCALLALIIALEMIVIRRNRKTEYELQVQPESNASRHTVSAS